ncbi:MAG: uL22 family ribosomal protein [Candidatus Aenigmatarchaeota archaeon]
MLRYAYTPKSKNFAKAYGRGLSISTKHSVAICKAITGLRLDKAKKFLNELISERASLNGKYYTKTASSVLELLNSAEKNAEAKGLDSERLFVHASAHRGWTARRPRRFKLRGQTRRMTHIQVVLEER